VRRIESGFPPGGGSGCSHPDSLGAAGAASGRSAVVAFLAGRFLPDNWNQAGAQIGKGYRSHSVKAVLLWPWAISSNGRNGVDRELRCTRRARPLDITPSGTRRT